MIPKVVITDQGPQVPSLEATLSGVWDLLKSAFGQDLNTSMNTPQGQLATSLSAILTDERNQWVSYLNQSDPRFAQGRWQDAIGYIYFLEKKLGTRSYDMLTLVGLSGTMVRQGAQFGDTAGNQWFTTGDTVIGGDGRATISIMCEKEGPIEAAPNTITVIIKALTGLDRVYNEAAAVIGRKAESRLDFEARRKESVAANSKNMIASVQGAVSGLNDVLDVYVVDNFETAAKTVGKTNYKLIQNSLLVSVAGGSDQEIAKAILEKGGTGCSFNGNTEVTYLDNENFPERPPAYKVKFLRPKIKPIYFQVMLEDISVMTFIEQQAIKTAILNALTNGDGRARIAGTIVASRYIAKIAAAVGLSIITVKVGFTKGAYTDFIELGVDEFPSLNAFDIEII